MKISNKIFIFCLIILIGLSFGETVFAAKTLSLSKNISVNNTGDDAARTATLDLDVVGADNVNGLVFTLVYNPDIFTFEGLSQGDMPIDDGSTYDPETPPSAETIQSTLYYQANNKASEGIVMIAAAAANYMAANPADVFTVFKVKFKVKSGIGSGNYPINIQKTIIGPDTAANAGYNEPVLLPVAAGLAPDADPITAQTYDVAFSPGLITVAGGYTVSGTAVYGNVPEENMTTGVANLLRVSAIGDIKIANDSINEGAYSFSKVPSGTYKVEILSSRPGYQKHYITASFDVAGDNVGVDKVILSKYAAQSGSIMINGSSDYLSGLRIEIRVGDQVIATAAVDGNGNYVTPPLETPLPDTVKIYAVYGTSEQDITNSLSQVYDWTTLDLGKVSGIITGLCDGQLVEVLIRSESAGIQKAVLVTGSGGNNSYVLNNLLPAADYILSVVGEAIAVFYDGQANFNNASSLTVQKDQETSEKNFAFTCGDIKTISGTVTVDGDAKAGVTVKANNYNFTTWKFGSSVTDVDGKYEIKVAPSDDYYVYFEVNSLKYYHKMGSNAVTSRSDAVQVDVSTDSAQDIDIPVVIPVPDTAGLEGSVTLNRSKDNGGIALENYLVVLLTNDNIPTGFFDRTNPDGGFSFVNVPPGKYNVTLKPPAPYATQINEGLVLENGATITSDFIVDQNFRVTGAVKDNADGTTPVTNARVDILKSNGGKLRAPAFTDAQGLYSLYDIPSGVYTLAASHNDFYPAEKDDVQVVSDLPVGDILMTKGAIVAGTVSDENGVVGDATVTLRGLNYVKATKTKSDGTYQFNGLAANSPHMIKSAKKAEYKPYVPDDINTGDGGSTTNHPMTLIIPATTWTFGGTITDGNAGAVSGAYVMLYSATTGYRKVVQTNASGGFTFSRAIDGDDYSLLILPGGGKPEIFETNISIQADKTDYAVVVPATAVISGTITLSASDANAIVIAGAYDPLTGVVHEVKTENPSADDQTFTYSIQAKSGVDYKVFAQDMLGTYPLKYYAADQAQTTGNYAQSTVVINTNTGVDITLTP